MELINRKTGENSSNKAVLINIFKSTMGPMIMRNVEGLTHANNSDLTMTSWANRWGFSVFSSLVQIFCFTRSTFRWHLAAVFMEKALLACH